MGNPKDSSIFPIYFVALTGWSAVDVVGTTWDHRTDGRIPNMFSNGLPLVNVYITMENHHAIHGKNHYFYGDFPSVM